jgi:hypothetical protein
MGKEIVYCSVCGGRILESDFKKGKAVTVLKRNYCPNCAKDVVKESAKRRRLRAPNLLRRLHPES